MKKYTPLIFNKLILSEEFSLDKSVPAHWIKWNVDEQIAEFSIDKLNYIVHFIYVGKIKDGIYTSFEFRIIKRDGKKLEYKDQEKATHFNKYQFNIFATIKAVVEDYVKKEMPVYLGFMANEKSKIGLYKKFLPLFYKEFNYKLVFKVKGKEQDSIGFVLKKESYFDDEDKKMSDNPKTFTYKQFEKMLK